MNNRNNGVVIGRLVRDVKRFTNKDNSQKVFLTIAAKRNFKNAKGEYDTDFISVEGFIPSNKTKTVFDYIKKGDMVAVAYTIRTSAYTDATGKTNYTSCLFVQNVDILAKTQNTNVQNQEVSAPTIGTPAMPISETPDQNFVVMDDNVEDLPF